MEGSATSPLRRLVGALIFGARHPVTVDQIRRTLAESAELYGGEARSFAGVRDADILQAIAELREETGRLGLGFHLAEVAQGFKFQSDPEFGIWLRHLLDERKPARLSRPALETLAIIAYRQPVMRSEIEAIRGVNVDHIVKMLLEMQLIRIAGRSELPGRPLMYGTTDVFLEHFGLKDVKELPGIDELSRIELQRRKKAESQPQPAAAEEEEATGESKAADSPAPSGPQAALSDTQASAEPASEPDAAGDGTGHGSDGQILNESPDSQSSNRPD